ncbi:AAA family ATPase [Acetanaerobacterium elongatum]|uniref:AAA domain (Dynein-related subfamily) n=1 Tax=Acetanaerobacterium elongatum TaxID=258515 RepID=A0A1G9YLR7_9FIRM|nr:AAA family ATPase [Acetanaerobacterium elongatum]SDN10060.1 AAA domain (dynein-related subfamily) [Acetanaerobacterium elongatum]
MDNAYQWVPFYEALADKLLTYSNKRDELFALMKKLSSEQPLMKYLHFEREDWWGPRRHQIDPFSVIGVMNRGTTDANRIVLAKVLANAFDIRMPAPTQFAGIPVLNNMNSFFNGTSELWELFCLAIKSAETGMFSDEFKKAFDDAIAVNGNGLAYITMGLYWIRPHVFMPLDGNSRAYISTHYGVSAPSGQCSGEEYVTFLNSLKTKIHEQAPDLTLPEISYTAWTKKDANALNGASAATEAVDEKQQRAAFKQWYMNNVGSSNSANTISTAISKARLKNGRAVFAIADFNELDSVIKSSGLEGYFQASGGDYSKMDIVFDIDPATQRDDLKSGIKYYLSFLKSIGELSSSSGATRQTGGVKMAKNIILYGTPGTGKTYSTVQYAVAIIEEKSLTEVKSEDYGEVFNRYLKYKEDGLIAFTTFHQSFGYEEFIEGIRPVVSSEENAESVRDIEYEVHDGVFKAFCNKAGTPIGGGTSVDLGIGKSPTVWKVSLEGTGDNPTRTECMENNHIRIGWDSYGETISDATDYSKDGGSTVLNAFYNRMQIGDIVMSCYSSKTIDAIGVITGEPEWHDEYQHYKRLRNVKWLVKGINEDIVDFNAGKAMTLSSVYKLSVSVSDALQILRKVKPSLFTQKVKIPNRVFIIDEINRGNISKIFGELITLIEPSKRIGASEQLRALLPYSGQNFGVPDNVYIIGTMNTADRSIAMIDTALRRRFEFIEMQPDSATLKDVLVDGIDIAEMLDTINKRITVLLDREHTIGHSYLLPLKSDPSIENLAAIFENRIIPLLQEYFYDDYEKIQLVLGDNQKPDDSTRFIVKKADVVKLFGNADVDFPEYYEVNSEAFMRIDAYAFL